MTTLLTPEGESLLHAGETPWTVYPRPQLKRDSFFCLNGDWTVRINGGEPETIRVPFAPESALSGLNRRLGKNPGLVYERRFTLPDDFLRERLLLHFGGVDQIARVTLNGRELGSHHGGYEPFSFDITDAAAPDNLLRVEVTDELSRRILPYGKQCEKRGGMWYTPVSGIWQTVWLESVCGRYVTGLTIDTDGSGAVIQAHGGIPDGEVIVRTPDGDMRTPLTGGRAEVRLDAPRLWSPEDPWLYRFTLTAGDDRVESYFALRTLSVERVKGIPRLCLNGKPYFFHGLLDQGYYSDGIFTPASPANYTRDILEMKALGFNMLRKHIKVEPEFFYAECDRLGMVVFQDMVNNGRYSFLRDTALPTIGLRRLPGFLLRRNKRTRAAFIEGMERTVTGLANHPCICCWTIFNEGWGQFDGGGMYERLRALDGSRFIDTASGWFGGVPSDVESLHIYFKPVKVMPSEKPLVLSEFGGYSWKPEGHVFNTEKTYGYRLFDDRRAFEDAFVKLYEEEIIPAVEQGLCAAVYTQLSDVEDETNGLLSYDRRVCKVDGARIRPLAEKMKKALDKG